MKTPDSPQCHVNFGRKRIITLIDTGAEISVMKDTVLKKIPSNYIEEITEPHYKRCVGPDGSPLIPTKTARITLDFGDTVVTHPFLVVNNVRKDLIIGSDFLMDHKAKVDLDKMTLKLHGEKPIELFLLAGDRDEPRVPTLTTSTTWMKDETTWNGMMDGPRLTLRRPTRSRTPARERRNAAAARKNEERPPAAYPKTEMRTINPTKTAKYKRRRRRRAELRAQRYAEQMLLHGTPEEMDKWLQSSPVRKARGKPTKRAHPLNERTLYPSEEEEIYELPTVPRNAPLTANMCASDTTNSEATPHIGYNEAFTREDQPPDVTAFREFRTQMNQRLLRTAIDRRTSSRERQPRYTWNRKQRIEHKRSQMMLREGRQRERAAFKEYIHINTPHLQNRRPPRRRTGNNAPRREEYDAPYTLGHLHATRRNYIPHLPSLTAYNEQTPLQDYYWHVPETPCTEPYAAYPPPLVWDDEDDENAPTTPPSALKDDPETIGGAKPNIGHQDPAVRQKLMELLKKNEDLFAPTDAEIGRTEILLSLIHISEPTRP